MKRIFKYIVIAAFATSWSCSDFFEPDNSSVIFEGDENSLTTDVVASLLGIYSSMQDLADPIILLGELRADMMDVTADAPQELKDISNLVYRSSNEYLSQNPFYEVVNNCDDILDKMIDVMDSDPTFTETLYLNYQAEATCAKCWTLWQIAQLFGQVEIDGQVYTLADTATKLIEILESHRNNFMINSLSADWFRSRCNKWSTYALLGELKLANEDFMGAALEFKSVIDIDGDNYHKLSSTYETSSWYKIFLDVSTAQYEVLFAVDYNASYKQYNSLQDFAEYYVQCTDGVVAEMYEDADTYRTEVTFSDSKILKYSTAITQASSLTQYEGATPLLVYRAADIHLLYAECLNHLGLYEDALMYVNSGDVMNYTATLGVRGRVGLGNIEGDTVIDPDDAMKVVDMMILAERGRELAFEGKRWADLVRFDKYYPEENILENALRSKNESIVVPTETYVNF